MKKIRQKLRTYLQPLFYRLKVRRYCKPALGNLDDLIEQYIGFKNGFFVEAGANNGYSQSNTYSLEALKGWHGLLIEPVPSLWQMCKRNRPGSISINAALVSDEYASPTVELEYANLMTSVSASSGNKAFDAEHIQRGRELEQGAGCGMQMISAPAKTLTQIFDENEVKKIDFMSLDLEGYEVEALKGLDLARYAPERILVEVRDPHAVLDILGQYYEIEATLTDNGGYQDILYKKKAHG